MRWFKWTNTILGLGNIYIALYIYSAPHDLRKDTTDIHDLAKYIPARFLQISPTSPYLDLSQFGTIVTRARQALSSQISELHSFTTFVTLFPSQTFPFLPRGFWIHALMSLQHYINMKEI